jgi:hypothetical protein
VTRSQEVYVKKLEINIAAGLLAAALAATVGCISEKAANRISPDEHRVAGSSEPMVMPEIVITARPTGDASRITMMPEVVVTGERLPDVGPVPAAREVVPDNAGVLSPDRLGYGPGRHQN